MQDIELTELARDETMPRIAVIGGPGTGKSSLINKLSGADKAVTGATTDLTKISNGYQGNGCVYVDTQGYGTRRFDVDAVLDNPQVEDALIVLMVFDAAAKFSGYEETALEKLLESLSDQIVILVFNKVDDFHFDSKKRREKALKNISEKEKDILNRMKRQPKRPKGMPGANLNVANFDPERHCLFISVEEEIGLEELARIVYDNFPQAIRSKYSDELTTEALEGMIQSQQAAWARYQMVSPVVKQIEAQATIASCSIFCGAVAAIPIPAVDILLTTPAQIGMIAAIAQIYHRPVTSKIITTIFASLGVQLLGRAVVQSAIKLVELGIAAFSLGTALPVALAVGAIGVGVAVSGTILIGETTLALMTHDRLLTEKERGAAKKRAEEFQQKYEGLRKEYEEKLRVVAERFHNKEIGKDEFETETKSIEAQLRSSLRVSAAKDAIF